jgi:hypothetical protein
MQTCMGFRQSRRATVLLAFTALKHRISDGDLARHLVPPLSIEISAFSLLYKIGLRSLDIMTHPPRVFGCVMNCPIRHERNIWNLAN